MNRLLNKKLKLPTMQKNLLFLAALATSALVGCSNVDELESVVVPSKSALAAQAQAPVVDNSLFPIADDSYSLEGKSALRNFNKLIVHVAPEKGLDRKKIDVDDKQLEEIKIFTDKLLKDAKNDTEKLHIVNKWVKTTIGYNPDPQGQPFSNDSYSVFKNRVAVCQGFSNLMRTMLYTQNIATFAVNGTLLGVGGHAWLYAYADKTWYAADPTNATTPWTLDREKEFATLSAEMALVNIFEDENFVYNYHESRLNIKEVKKSGENLVVPFSINGFRVSSFNPDKALPSNVRNIYLGSNITTIGESMVGLVAHRSSDEAIFVDPKNPRFGSEHGALYRRNHENVLSRLVYIPSQMRSLKIRPVPKLWKNLIYNHPVLEEIILQPGTKSVGSYAIENCPNLKRVYVPTDCKLQENAIFRCSPDVEIFKGNSTGIAKVRM